MLVVLDACVLYPPSLRDLLLTLGALDVIEVRWSEEILDEVTRNVVADHPDIDRERFEQHTIAAMHRHFPEALVVVDADVISSLDNDPKDRHVAAVAICAGVEAIVTFNIKDFGGDRLPTAPSGRRRPAMLRARSARPIISTATDAHDRDLEWALAAEPGLGLRSCRSAVGASLCHLAGALCGCQCATWLAVVFAMHRDSLSRSGANAGRIRVGDSIVLTEVIAMTDTDMGIDLATLAGLPLMLTVGEAAAVLRISRTSAYKLAQEWRWSHGTSGLPTVRLGSRLLVRRVDLAVIVGLDPTG